MKKEDFEIIGKGIYSVSDAARFSKVNAARIRRWLRGYSYTYKGEKIYISAVFDPGYEILDSDITLNFLDLIEVRFINAFRDYGVSWKIIKLASEKAKELIGKDHPFSTRVFLTDRKRILAQIADDAKNTKIFDLVSDQYVMENVMSKYLFKGLEFTDDDIVRRWWPLGNNRRVVLDPERSFGQPIVSKRGIPTSTLMKAFSVEGSIEKVVSLYEVDKRSVLDAIEFEEQLAA